MAKSKTNTIDIGLLILRLFSGLSLAWLHGYPKLLIGTDGWEVLGKSLGIFGFHTAPVIFGCMAMLAELVGGLCIAAGIGTKVAATAILLTMMVAFSVLFNTHNPPAKFGELIVISGVMLCLLFTGPGRYSVSGWRRTK